MPALVLTPTALEDALLQKMHPSDVSDRIAIMRIQEETTFKQIPCLTLRPNTERPSTIEIGSNTLLDFDVTRILELIKDVFNGQYKSGQIPELWDGNATQRVLQAILDGLD